MRDKGVSGTDTFSSLEPDQLRLYHEARFSQEQEGTENSVESE